MQDDNVEPQASDEDLRLDFLCEIEERICSMNPKPDERDWLREGREDAMYGDFAGPRETSANVASSSAAKR